MLSDICPPGRQPPTRAQGVGSCMAMLCVALWLAPAAAGGPDAVPALRRTRLNVIYSSSLFRTVSRNDAIAAMQVWLATVGRQKGFTVDAHVFVADDLDHMRRLLRETPPGVVLLDPLEYFELAGLGVLDPAFFGAKGRGDEAVQYLLLARQDPGITALADLRGKSLVTYASSRAELGRKWVEVLLHESGLGPADRFFGALSSVTNPSAAVLPVFFGKTGAGVVDRASFEVMKEMNPQLGSKLRTLAVTPPLLDGILCVHKQLLEYRDELLESLRQLHQDPAGSQILLVFKSNKLRPVDPEILERVREIGTKYRRIAQRQESRPSKSGEAR